MNLWLAQILAVFRLEWKKTFFAKRGLWIYLVALAPVLLYTGHAIVAGRRGVDMDFGEQTNIFAGIFQIFYLRLAVFFGCVGIFMNLIRGEMLDRSLHFYFLAPIRREVLMAGKFIAGMFAAGLIFGASTVLQFIANYAYFDTATIQEYFLRGDGISHVLSYIGVTLLACLGYGSVFLGAGVLVRNPIIPAGVVLVWEAINPFLPAFLQKLSVIYYLKSLCPVEVPPQVGPPLSLIAVNVDPVPAIVAVPGLLALSAIVVLWSGYKIRRLEINYGAE